MSGRDVLCFLDEPVGVVPILEQLRLRHVVQPDVQVLKVSWVKVVDLARHVQDVPDTTTVSLFTALE